MTTQNIFLTGGTGFIGKELIKGLLKQEHTIYLLIRSGIKASAQLRFHQLLNEFPVNSRKQLKLIEGDVSLKHFGLSEKAFQSLAEKINCIYHSAASVQLTAPLEEVRSINVKGTQTVLELAYLAAKTHFNRLNYISTAYVAGKRSGIIYENELDCKQTFNNNYEQAKFEAELLVEQAKQDLPICIYRPSMVMGHSETGWTSAFNVLYGPIKMGYFGNLPFVPGCSQSKIDAIPINYVSDSILHLSQLAEHVNGKTFHITVGLDRSISVKELLSLASKNLIHLVEEYSLHNPIKKPLMIHPQIFKGLSQIIYHTASGERKAKLHKLLTYVNYTLYYKEFDNSEAKKYLVSTGVNAPRLQDYIDVICRYAVEHHFGKAEGPQDVYHRSWLSKKSNPFIEKKMYQRVAD